MESYFSKEEIRYHLTTIRHHYKMKHVMEEHSINKAITALNSDADVIDFVLLSAEENGFGVNRVVFTKLAEDVYTPSRLAYQMVLEKEPVSIESFEKKKEQVKTDWDTTIPRIACRYKLTLFQN